jgi:small-conductance mechanosensitive channel
MSSPDVFHASSVISAELFTIGTTVFTPLTLLTLVVTILLSYAVSRALRAMLRGFLQRGGMAASGGEIGATERLVHYGIMLTGIAMAARNAGIRLDALFTAGAVFAVGFGFAMQNIAQNFVSGVILLIERSIKPGDVIEIGNQIVKVQQMSIRATIVRTLDEEDVIVPNSSLVQANVKNFTLEDNIFRVRVTVGVSYHSDTALVRRVLEEAARSLSLREPGREGRVLLLSFGPSALEYETSVWMRDPWNHRILGSRLRKAIFDAFKEHQIAIAFPQMDVHFDSTVNDSLRAMRRAASPSVAA